MFRKVMIGVAVGLLFGLAAASTAVSAPVDSSEACDIQRALAKRGLYDGEIDCDFGPLTRAAIRKFQERQGLYVDGVVGEDTFKQLMGAWRRDYYADGERRRGPAREDLTAAYDPDGGLEPVRDDEPASRDGLVCREPMKGKADGLGRARAIYLAKKAWSSNVATDHRLGTPFVVWSNSKNRRIACTKASGTAWVTKTCVVESTPCADPLFLERD